MNSTQEMFQRRPKSLNAENPLHLSRDDMPHITWEEREVEVYVANIPSSHDVQNICELQYFLHEDQATRVFYNYKTYDKVTIDELSPAEQSMRKHGIQQQTITAPIYTVQIDPIATSEEIAHFTRVFLDPDLADEFFQEIVNVIVQAERDVSQNMGHKTPQEFLRESAAAPLVRHFGVHEFLLHDKPLWKLRKSLQRKLEDHLHKHVRTLSYEDGQDFEKEAFLKFAAYATTELYSWFNVEDHGEYPLHWLMTGFINVEEVKERLLSELPGWCEEYVQSVGF